MAQLSFRNEDEEAQYCLSALRDGSPDAKIDARARLAAIFARRGLFEQAAEQYELNIRAGVRTPDLFEQLSETYRALGDAESAEAALVAARRYRPAGLQPAPNGVARTVPGEISSTEPLPFDVPRRAHPGPAGESAHATAAVPGRPRRAGLPRPLVIVGAVVFAVIVPVVLLGLLVVNPVGLYLEGRAAGPTIDIGSPEIPRLKIAPATPAIWYLRIGRSVSGLWATPGLDLTLDEPLAGAGQTIVVTAPHPQVWGETITIVERRGQGRANQETVIPATLDAPEQLPPAGTILNGRIAGDVTSPRLSETIQFTTVTERIDVPVQLVVVDRYELWADRFVHAARMFFDEDRWLLVTIGSLLVWCVLAGTTALLLRSRPA